VSISTKKGDDGTTGLLFGGRVRKDSERPVAYGDVDELQAQLGVVRAESAPTEDETSDLRLSSIVLHLQKDLWVLMAELATDEANAHKLVDDTSRVTAQMLDGLDLHLEQLEALGFPQEFVVPGENRIAALLDVARTVARRAERSAITAMQGQDSYVVPYLNRLSDVLWTLARWQEHGSRTTRSITDDD
jgi:cob(I)alamin adenosyltransferase